MTKCRYAWQTATMDPGLLDSAPASTRTNTCPVCGALRSDEDKAHHCRKCDRCVVHFDHHCGVLGVCIGKYNFMSFIALVLFGSLGHAILGHVATCNGQSFLTSLYVIYIDSLLLHWPPDFSAAVDAALGNVTVLYFYTMAALLLGFGVLQYYLRFGLRSSTYEMLCRRRDTGSSNVTPLSGRCPRCCSISELMQLAHRIVDPMSPAGYRGGGTIHPSIRYKVNCCIPMPFVLYSLHIVATSLWPVEVAYHILAIACAAIAMCYMRRVVMGTYPHDTGGHYCRMCDGTWLGQDHHCGAFGTCVHGRNRKDYIRFILLSALCVVMYFPYGALYLWRNWIWSGSWLSISTWIVFAKRIALPLIIFNVVSMLPMFLFGCVLQQYIYLLIVDTARNEKAYSKSSLWWKDVLADFMFATDDVRRFQRESTARQDNLGCELSENAPLVCDSGDEFNL